MARLSKDLEVAIEKSDQFAESIKAATMDELAKAPLQEVEPQTKLSTREMAKMDGDWLKPDRQINSKESFNEKYRKEYEYRREYVPFIAEHKEIIGETIELWCKPFAGVSAEFWKVPTNKKVWGPRYLAEQISRKNYTRLVMEDRPVNQDGVGTYYGQFKAESRIARLDAKPARGQISVAMSSDF